MDSCQFVEYLFKIKIYIFQFLKTKKGDNVSFVYFYKIITFGTIHLVRTQYLGEGGGGICSYVRKEKISTATKTKKQPNDTGIICVTNSTRKICKIPAFSNLEIRR